MQEEVGLMQRYQIEYIEKIWIFFYAITTQDIVMKKICIEITCTGKYRHLLLERKISVQLIWLICDDFYGHP